MKTVNLVVSSLAALALVACGSSNSSSSGSSGTSATNAGSGSNTTNGAGGSSGSASTGSTGAASTSSSGSSGAASTNGSSSSSSTTTSASSSGSTGVSTSGSSGSSGGTTGNTTPITAPDLTWTWVDFPNAHCRDGSATGIGVNINPNSTKLMIYLQGGGACFSYGTCVILGNAASFGSTDFTGVVSQQGNAGIFQRDAGAANPVADWSQVFIPYCTGDVHAGNNPSGTVANVTGTQEFVGYANVGAYLQRLTTTFPNVTEVLLTGESAGGFGAAANFDQVSAAFPNATVNLVDDSGPLMEDPYLPSCMQDYVRQLWGLDSTLLADCGADCPDTSNYMLDYAKHAVGSHPNAQAGLIESTDDGTITLFFGQGANNCASINPGTQTAEDAVTFDAGLMDIRNSLAGDTNFGTFYFAGTDHTSLSEAFYTRTAGGVTLNQWVGDIVDGGVSNTGP